MPATVTATQIPWTAIVGIAGIAGTVLATYLTNRSAAERVRLQQNYEDSRRFHAERRELYGKLLAQAQTCRELSVRNHNHENNPLSEDSDEAMKPLALDAFLTLSMTGKQVQLIATAPTQTAADTLVKNATVLIIRSGKGKVEFDFDNKKLHEAETALRPLAQSCCPQRVAQ
ncbi:MAG TPA: hypothetical protein VGG63_06645 [Steroidobacteraceae bacterium]